PRSPRAGSRSMRYRMSTKRSNCSRACRPASRSRAWPTAISMRGWSRGCTPCRRCAGACAPGCRSGIATAREASLTESPGAGPTGRRRILVAIDPARVRAAPIAAAALLARELDMELTAVVVEEQSWLRVAALPFARELRLASGQWQAFEASGVEQLFREHVRRVEATLARVCAAGETRFSVTVERGTYPRRAIESASA